MILVNRKNDRLTGSINSVPYSIPYDKDVEETLKVLSDRLKLCKDRETFNAVIEDAKKAIQIDFKAEVAAANGYLKYRKDGHYYLVVNKGEDNETVSDIPLPKALSDRIIQSYEEKSDFMPIILAWQRFLAKQLILETKKPNGFDLKHNCELFANYITAMYVDKEKAELLMESDGVSQEVANELATFNDIAITNFGILVTYKVVDEIEEIWSLEKDKDGNDIKVKKPIFTPSKKIDPISGKVDVTKGKADFAENRVFTPAIHKSGDKFFCGEDLSYMYKVGKMHVLPEDAVRNYQNTFGGGGLYAGGLNYIEGYRSNHNVTLTCFIDPFDIISFQDDGRAFRTDGMFINGILNDETELQGMYFDSDFAAASDEVIKKRMIEVVTKHTSNVKDENSAIESKVDLLNSILKK
jgi:hypothetical protein